MLQYLTRTGVDVGSLEKPAPKVLKVYGFQLLTAR